MSDLPNWLPPEIEEVDSWDSGTYDVLYDVFCSSLKGKLLFMGKRVWFFPEKEDGRELIFWHLTSRDEYETVYDHRGRSRKIKSGGRLTDFPRCRRLRWIRAILERCPCDEVLQWEHKDGDGNLQTYVWLKDHDFVVILKNYDDGTYRLKTSYHLDGTQSRKNMKDKYENSLVKKTGPQQS
jgi:hypothetical protein